MSTRGSLLPCLVGIRSVVQLTSMNSSRGSLASAVSLGRKARLALYARCAEDLRLSSLGAAQQDPGEVLGPFSSTQAGYKNWRWTLSTKQLPCGWEAVVVPWWMPKAWQV